MKEIIKMLQEYKDSHESPSSEFEKGFIAGINESINQLKQVDELTDNK